MGSDDLFKKRREARKQRSFGEKRPRANSFLIVTEGERTEPYYFRGLQRLIQEKLGGTVDVVEVPMIDIHGEGCATRALINRADEIIRKAKVFYQNIWVVFDKDSFEDFDDAIQERQEKGYKIAWSNQSFEYWLFLHFEYSDAALDRHDWNDKLNGIFKKYGLGDGEYSKSLENIYELVDTFDGVSTAIKYAKRRMSEFDEQLMRPSEFDPGTKVHLLVEELKNYLL